MLPRARSIEAEVVQIFPQSPRQWKPTPYPAEELAWFGAELAAADLPLYLHAIYLVNPASVDLEVQRRSAASLAGALSFGARAGARGVVCHLGSRRGGDFETAVQRVAETVSRARDQAGEEVDGPLPRLLLETSAGTRGAVGVDPEELETLLRAVPGEAGLCLDTAHLFAAGHPIHTPDGLDAYLDQLHGRVGLGRVGLVHLNDSQVPLGGGGDRHENLGEGKIGLAGLGLWVTSPNLGGVDFVIETPGLDRSGPDRENLCRAKGLRRSM